MPLLARAVAEDMKAFIKKANTMEQADADVAIENYCAQLEKVIYTAIKSLRITIPPGLITVTGGPAAQANPNPIIIEGIIS